MQQFSGADFPPDFNPNDVMASDWGDLLLRFVDDDTLDVEWSSTQEEFGSGQISTTRFTSLKGCEP